MGKQKLFPHAHKTHTRPQNTSTCRNADTRIISVAVHVHATLFTLLIPFLVTFVAKEHSNKLTGMVKVVMANARELFHVFTQKVLESVRGYTGVCMLLQTSMPG